jgi:hypothetical protein
MLPVHITANSHGHEGYALGEKVHEEILDMIEREAENTDSLEVLTQVISCI